MSVAVFRTAEYQVDGQVLINQHIHDEAKAKADGTADTY